MVYYSLEKSGMTRFHQLVVWSTSTSISNDDESVPEDEVDKLLVLDIAEEFNECMMFLL